MLEIQPLSRDFLPDDFKVTTWEAIKPYADDLLNRKFQSLEDYRDFLEDVSELLTVLSEDGCWRYVHMSRDTRDEKLKAIYEDYTKNIDPPLEELRDKINHKIANSPFAGQISEAGFDVMLKKIQTQISIFREENIPLNVRISDLVNDVNALRGVMSVNLDGKSLTLQEAEDRMLWQDRAKRQEAWEAMRARLEQDKEALDSLFVEMYDLRQAKAKNAGFDNFRDYMFAAYNRFDYTPQDCFTFHDGVREHIVPVIKKMYQIRKSQMKVDQLYPWDLAVDPFNRQPIKAFDNEDDLIEKTIAVLESVDPDFADTLRIMKANDRFDLMARPGKQPGAYNMPLYESNVSYIFANFTAKPDDVATMVHEAGHAIHETLMSRLSLIGYRDYPMEVAELGSMTMELLSSPYWGVFYKNKADLYRAQREHLEDIVIMLPWMAIVDEFQHKIYTDTDSSVERRHQIWEGLRQSYLTGEVETQGSYPHPTRVHWHKQGHIFENPFYYIDYAIAQMGALQIWRNYKRDPQKAVQQFKYAMSLGATRSRPEIYAAAGIEFNFSSDMLNDLMTFVSSEITRLGELEMAELKK